MFRISPSARLRPSPFFEAVVADGLCQVSSYNHMLLPTGYGDPEAEYWRLINGVAMWDVAAERQVQLHGPDALALAQILAPRDLSRQAIGQGRYVPLCNHDGVLINDPIVLKLAEDRVWLSIADSDIGLWARAIAAERGLEVRIDEPDVSPLAVQGPKAVEVVAALFGDWVRELKYFWFRETDLDGIPVLVQRSGWSKQGGFEIYLRDGAQGTRLWQRVKAAGAPHGIGPGGPNASERVESGLVSYGGDTDPQTNPFEVRMGKFVDLELADEVIGIRALRRIHAEGARRHTLGVVLERAARIGPVFRWAPISRDGERVGDMTNGAWSYRLAQNIGFALVERRCQPGDRVSVDIDGEACPGRLVEMPFC